MAGRTVVRFDPGHGPYRFERPPGVEVPCVCDGDHLVCAYHVVRGTYDPAVWEPVPRPENENVQGKSSARIQAISRHADAPNGS